MINTIARWSVSVGAIWAALADCGRAENGVVMPPDADARFQALVSASPRGQALTQFMDVWLEGEGFDGLREYLKRISTNPKITAIELRSIAVVWSRLDQNEAALADLRRAAEISRGDAAISLESARLEARLQLFKEAIVSLDQIGADADMNTVKEATELRWSIARSQGGDTQALAKLRLLSEARLEDAPLRFQLARWEAERGNSDRVLPFLRQRVAEEKDAVLREQWRRVLVDALQYHGLADEAVRAAVDGALAAEVGSATEEEFIADLVGTFQQRRFEGAITPSPAEVATALAKRPTALLAMADVMRLRGEGAAAVEVVASLAGAQPDNGALAFIWADLLADDERFAEAIEVLKSRIAKKPDDASAHGRLAVILREAGRESEGAKLLQEWAVASKPDEVRIRKVAALLPLFLPAVEVKAWTDAATKNLPKPKRIEIRKEVLVESVPPEIQQIEKSGDPAEKRIGQLLELRRRLPKSDSVALALVKAFISAGREPEAWHVMISRHERCEEAEETRKWWRDVVSLEQTFGSLHSQPVLSRLQDMRREQNENANYWAAIAEVATLSGDMNSRIVAQTEELRLSPSDVGLRLELADALAESGATADARRMVAPLLRGPLAAKALVFLACLELSSGRFDSAERILVEVIDDPSSDARDMEELAVRLMGWRRWTMATALLDAQRTVHPKDYRLACLHGIALKEGGDLESAAAVFLGLGAFRDEINDRPAHKLLLRRYFGEVRPNEGKSSDPMSVWLELSRAVQEGLNYQGAMSAMVGERRSRGMEQTLSLAPMQVNECGARAMAHLMNIAREATVGEKAALTQRARAAGLPMPEALLIGKLERQNDTTTLVLDEDAVRTRISEPVVAHLWISNRRIGRSMGRPASFQPDDDAKIAQQCVTALFSSNAPAALDAALHWWKCEPASEEATSAVVKCIGRCDGTQGNAMENVSQTMLVLPSEIRRDPARAENLSRALHAWRERIAADDAGAKARAAKVLASCFIAMGRWEEAAMSLDEAAVFALSLQPSRIQFRQDEYDDYQRVNAIPAWMHLQLVSPLVWPLVNAGADKIYVSGMFPQLADSSGLANGVAEADLATFLAAGKAIKDRQVRLSWLIAGRDEAALISEVRAWAKADPSSTQAMLLAACVAAHEKENDRALDILYGLVGAQKDEEGRRTAQMLYLRAVLFEPGQNPFNPEGRVIPRVPLKAHRKRVAAILRDLHPLLVPFKRQLGDGWQAIFIAGGLVKESEALAVNREFRQRGPGLWLQANRDFFERSNERRNRRGSDERIAPYHIERLMKEMKRDRAIILCLAGLRREADERYLAEMQRGENLEEWRRVIASAGLSADLMKAADPGARRSFGRLAQAMHVAAVCDQWKQAVVFGSEALKLVPESRVLQIALIQAKQRAGGDASEIVEALKLLPPDEARFRLRSLLNSVRTSRDTEQRIKLATAIVKLAAERPEVMRSERDGNSQIVSETFRMLAEPVITQDTETPALLAELQIRVSEKQKTNPETPEQFGQRRQLIASLCDATLKNPAWGNEALRYLTSSYLIEKKPTADELASYIREVAKLHPQNGRYVLDNWLNSSAEFKQASNRLRIARLALNLLPEFDSVGGAGSFESSHNWSPEGLVHLIGDHVSGGGILPLYALWEHPGDITEGENVYSKEQLALNKVRKELFAELWKLAETRAAWQTRMLPFWAGYRLHYSDGKEEVLDGMRKLKDKHGDAFAFREVVQIAAQSYSMENHVALAEITNTLLLEEKSLIDQPAVPRLVEQVMKLVADGRTNESPLPPLNLSAAEAEKMKKGISAALQKRRQAVHERLQRQLGDRIPPTPDSLLRQIEIELRAGKDTAKTEKALVAFAKTDGSKLAEALNNFVLRTRVNRNAVGQVSGYGDVVWDLGLRVRWFEAVLRIGRSLVEQDGAERGQSEWLRLWIVEMMHPNKQGVPPIPPIAGLEIQHGYAGGSTKKLYASMPLVKKRDALFVDGMEIAMKLPALQADFFHHFAAMRMDESPPNQKAVTDMVLPILKINPNSFSSSLRNWLGFESTQSSLPRVLACGEIARKFVEAWPADADSSSDEWLRAARSVLFQDNFNDRIHKKLPLLPGVEWNRNAYEQDQDVNLATPGAPERHAAWMKIVDAAALKSNLAPHVFADFARLHLVTAPDRVSACAILIMRAQPEKLRWAFDSIYENESAAPQDRRIEWGRLVLRLMPMVKGNGAINGDSPSWLAATLKFLQSKRREYDQMPKEAPLTEEMIRQRDDLVAMLTEAAMGSPGLAIESLVPHARKQFQMGAMPDVVLELVRKAMVSDASRVSDQLRAWCDALLNEKAEAKERMWAAQVLVPMAEAWPVGTNGPSGYWMERVGHLIGRGAVSPDDQPPELSTMMERLMDAALKQGAVGSSMIASYALTKTGKAKVQLRLSAKAREDAVIANGWMSGWWRDNEMFRLENRISAGFAAEGILLGWPREAPAETLTWTFEVLRQLALPALADPIGFHREPRQEEMGTIPAPPSDAVSLDIARKIVAELIRRKVRFDWLTPTRLRHAFALEADTARKPAAESIFKANPERDEAVAYLQRTLEPEKTPNGMGEFRRRRDPRDFSHDARVSETLDGVRCVQMVAEGKWLPPEITASLLELSRARLREIASRQPLNQRNYFARENELPADQIEAARELLKLLAGTTTMSSGGKKVNVRPETLVSRLEGGLRAGEPTDQLADEAWALVKSNPIPTADALRSWASRVRQSYRIKAYAASCEVALILAQRWTDEQPAPDWLVTFVSYWSPNGWLAEPGQQSPSREEVLEHLSVAARSVPKLIATLKKFPSCQDSGYFRVVSPQPSRPMEGDATEAELVELALVHIQAHQKGGISQAGQPLPLLPVLAHTRGSLSDKVPLYSALETADAHLFLIEYAWRNKKEEWLREVCRPAIESGQWLSKIDSFDRLVDLYFCRKDNYAKNAAEFARDGLKGGVAVSELVKWTLRVAKLRSINIDADTWARIVDIATQVADSSGRAHSSSWVVAWLVFRHEMNAEDLNLDLRDILRVAMEGNLTAKSAVGALGAEFLKARSSTFSISSGYVIFDDPLWGWFWDTLQFAVAEPDCYGAALHVADEVGLLSERWCGEALMRRARTSSVALSEASWRRTLDASNLVHGAAMPSRMWLMPVDGLVPVWELARNVHLSSQPGAAKWLDDEIRVQPHVGRALLRLGARRISGNDISVLEIEAALAPCRTILSKQPRERLAQLTAALLVVQPRLMAGIADSDAGSVLKLLPPPAVEPDLEKAAIRWLSMTPLSVPVPVDAGNEFRPLAYDLCRLIKAQAPQADAVFKAGVQALAGREWKGKASRGIPVAEWVREQVGLALIQVERDFKGSRLLNGSLEIMGPNDDNRRNVPSLLMTFMLAHADAFATTLFSADFDRLVESVWAARMEHLAWDGRTIAREFMSVSGLHPRSQQLIQFSGFRKALASVPITTVQQMSEEAVKAAAENPRHQTASWIFRHLLESETRVRLGQAEVAEKISPALFRDAAAEWRADDLIPAARLALAQAAPNSMANTQAPTVLRDWIRGMELRRPSEDSGMTSFWYLNGDLRWLSTIGDAGAMRQSIIDAAEVVCEWLKRPRGTAFESTATADGSFADRIVLPLAGALDAAGELEQRWKLVKTSAEGGRLPFEILLNELRRDAVRTASELVPAYLIMREGIPYRAFPPSTAPLTELTSDDEAAIASLRADWQEPSVQRTTLFVLSTLPDSMETAPKIARSARVTAFVEQLLRDSKFDVAAVDELISRRGIPETLLLELLPLLRQHPFVKQWVESGMKSLPVEQRQSGAVERTLSLWALAEGLYGGQQDSWTKLMAIFKQRSDGVRSSREKEARSVNSGGFAAINRAYVGRIDMPWQREASTVLFSATEWWLSTRPPADWPRLVRPFIEIAALGSIDATAHDFSDLLHHALPDFSTQALDAAFAAESASSGKWGHQLWSKIAASSMTTAQRLQILSRRLEGETYTSSIRNPHLNVASQTRLLTAGQFAALVDEAPLEGLNKQPIALVDWLIADGRKKEALNLLARLAEKPSAKVYDLQWLRLAVYAHDLGQDGLARRFTFGAVIPNLPRRHLLNAVEARLGVTP